MLNDRLRLRGRLVVAAKMALREIPKPLRRKSRVIYQSAEPIRASRSRASGIFDVCVVGHLRGEKDPLRAAMAVRDLPSQSCVFRSPTSVSLWIRGWKKPQSKKSDATRVIVGSATFHMEKLANAWRAVTSFALRPRWKAVPTLLSEALASRVPVCGFEDFGTDGHSRQSFSRLFSGWRHRSD